MGLGLLSCYTLHYKEITEECSEKELDYLRSRVSVIDGRILCYKEVPKMSTFSCNFVFDLMEKYASGIDGEFAVLVDLTEGSRPSKEVRKVLIPRFNKLFSQSMVCCFCVDKNILVKTALKFLLNVVVKHDYRIATTKDEALKIIHEKISE